MCGHFEFIFGQVKTGNIIKSKHYLEAETTSLYCLNLTSKDAILKGQKHFRMGCSMKRKTKGIFVDAAVDESTKNNKNS